MRAFATFSGLLGVFFALLAFDSKAADDFRKWTSADGRSIEAKFIGLEKQRSVVILELPEGRQFQYPVLKLSEESRGVLDELAPVNLKDAASELQAGLPESPIVILSEEAFLEGTYLNLVGRMPSEKEAEDFRNDGAPNKRVQLADQLIDSPEFAEYFVDRFGAVFGLVPEATEALSFSFCEAEAGRGEMEEIRKNRFYPPDRARYRDWLIGRIHENEPFDQLVYDLIVAKGDYHSNPATGFLLGALGSDFYDPSAIFRNFLGTEITCARCHDHPHVEVYQMDFYRFAAFFSELQWDLNPGLSGRNPALSDENPVRLSLPLDYQYDDGDPGMLIEPGVFFGDQVALDGEVIQREAFAQWLTSQTNPRFTINLVNRIWGELCGEPFIEPIDNLPGNLNGRVRNPEVMDSLLRLMRMKNYQIKDFLKILYRTQAFTGEPIPEP
ncbi:MAG: DUF1549 domain-containing protein [Verrucomicrobiota bacterium]